MIEITAETIETAARAAYGLYPAMRRVDEVHSAYAKWEDLSENDQRTWIKRQEKALAAIGLSVSKPRRTR